VSVATATRCGAAGLILAAAVAAPAVARASADESYEVTASRDGFRPASLKLRRGETVRLLLKTTDGEHCFAIDALRVEKRILPGRTTVLDLTPAQAGSFPFHCCLESGKAAERETGRLVVTE
jgi:heme/copper-type cytochrome/quinol oxidase subunit 2